MSLQYVGRALLLSDLIHNANCHAEDLCHFIEHCVPIIGIDYFVSPVINRTTDFLHHLLKIPHFPETFADDLVDHDANFTVLCAWDASPD
jgi:hypothetical protein